MMPSQASPATRFSLMMTPPNAGYGWAKMRKTMPDLGREHRSPLSSAKSPAQLIDWWHKRIIEEGE